MELAKLLKKEFEKRKKRNKSYSLRSFAAALKTDPTSLLRIMNGQRLPTLSTTRKLLTILGKSELLSSVQRELEQRKQSKSPHLKHQSFDSHIFESYFNTAHVVTLASLRLPNCALAKLKRNLLPAMRLSEDELEKIFADLELAGAIERNKSGIEVIYKNKSTVPLPLTSQKRRKIQKDFLAMAATAIDTVNIADRDNATLTVPIHKDDLEQAKQILQEARHKINLLSEKRKNNDMVYNVCTALYPVVS